MDYMHVTTSAPAALPKAAPHKQPMAVLAAPTRSFSGWASVRTSKLSRAMRRFIIIRSTTLTVCTTDNPRTALLSVPITGATLLPTSARFECHLRTSSHRLWIQWSSDVDLRTCKAAFEFANRHIDHYYKLVTHRQLGKGRNSEVVFAFDTSTGDHAAVKIINKDKARTTDREFAEKEVCIRMTVQHPCIVQTLDIFETPYDLFVVMELMNGGSLDRRMSKYNDPLTEHQARIVMCRLFSALRHLHARGIAHRNVKPENIFLDSPDDMRWPYTVKLSDFSLACFIHDPDAHKQIVGTPEYLAPCASIMTRTATGDRAVMFGTEVDMWAAGVTLYNLLSMDLPYEGDYAPDVFKKARLGNFTFTNAFDDVSSDAKSLIRALLNVDNRKRPTAQTALLHPWFDPLIDVSGCVPDDHEETRCHHQHRKPLRIIDDGAITHAPCVFESYEEYALSDGIRRFRYAAVAVIMMVRLCNIKFGSFFPQNRHRQFRHTTLLAAPPAIGEDGDGRVSSQLSVERRFQFNVSGIDIAPMHSLLEHAMSHQDIDHDDQTYVNLGSSGISINNNNNMSSSASITGAADTHPRSPLGHRQHGTVDMDTHHHDAVCGVHHLHDTMQQQFDDHHLHHHHDNDDDMDEHAEPVSPDVVGGGGGGGSTGAGGSGGNSGKDFGEGSLYVLQGRASGTVMSRVSTGSTVKSRSSRGTDCGATIICGATAPTTTSLTNLNNNLGGAGLLTRQQQQQQQQQHGGDGGRPRVDVIRKTGLVGSGLTSTRSGIPNCSSSSGDIGGVGATICSSNSSARMMMMMSSSSTMSGGGPGGSGGGLANVTASATGGGAAGSGMMVMGQQHRRRSDVKMERSDTSVDYFGQKQRLQQQQEQQDMDKNNKKSSAGCTDGGCGGAVIQERMLSDTADLVTSAVVAGATALAAAAAAAAGSGGGGTDEKSSGSGGAGKWRRRRRMLLQK